MGGDSGDGGVVVVGACMRLCHIFFYPAVREPGKRRVRGCEGNTQPQRRPAHANADSRLPVPDRSAGRPLPAQTSGQNGRQGWTRWVEISSGARRVVRVTASHSLQSARSPSLPPCHDTTAAIGRSCPAHSGKQRVWTIYMHTYRYIFIFI